MSDESTRDGSGSNPPDKNAPPGTAGMLPIGDTDSVYDELVVQAAYAPEVDPTVLSEMVGRTPRPESLVGQKLKHFRVETLIGQGGMGVVYRAEDELLRRPVALKVLTSWLADTARGHWLLDEARSAASVKHANIAVIYEVGQVDDRYFIAMEFVAGRSLRERISQGPLPVPEALGIAGQIAQGLAGAHQTGIVHRDLKPDNVMVGTDGIVKILDFGLAHAIDPAAPPSEPPEPSEPSAKLGKVVGTFAYMSPEQSRGEKVDARSDVFSFGIVLFEMLTGRRPATLLGAQGEARALELTGAPQPEALRDFLTRCLHPEAQARFENGAALGEALKLLSTPPEPPVPPPPAPTLRRRLWPMLAVGPVALLAVILLFHEEIIRWIQPHVELRERRITANPPDKLLVDAMISPDGKWIAYIEPRGLYLRQLNPEHTEQIRPFDTQPPETVSWFPSGTELLVTTNQPGTAQRRLWRVRVPSGEAHFVAEGAYEWARIAPDGEQFAFIDPDGGISVASLKELKPRVVVKVQEGDRLNGPVWSPDGRFLALLRIQPLTATLESVEVKTGVSHVLAQSTRLVMKVGDGAMTWGRQGVFYALAEVPPEEWGFSLWLQPMDREGAPKGKARRLRAWSGFSADMMSISRDDKLALDHFESQADVHIGELSPTDRSLRNQQRFTWSERDDVPSSFAPDDRGVLFTSDRDGPPALYLQKLDSSEATKLDLSGRDFTSWPTFSPNGDEILFWRFPYPATEQPRHAELVRARPQDVGGTPKHVLTSQGLSAYTWIPTSPLRASFRCVRAGCVLGEIQGNELVFSTFDPVTGTGANLGRTQTFSTDARTWELSPDGKRIVIGGGSPKLRIYTPGSGTLKDPEEREAPAGCVFLHPTFDTDGESVFATMHCITDAHPHKLVYLSKDGHLTVLLEHQSNYFARPILSRDGRHLAFGVWTLDNDLWLVEGL